MGFFKRKPSRTVETQPGKRAQGYLSRVSFTRPFKPTEFLDLLLADAIHLRATDVHMIPHRDMVQVRLRIDGALRDFLTMEPHHAKRLTGRLKVVGGMDFLNVFSPQDGAGRLPVRGQENEVPFRISTMPVETQGVARERAILRLFCEKDFDLQNLGFLPGTLEHWKHLLDEPQGMLVLTGPANSGKTTTIYASLLEIMDRSRGERNLATIEDPVEFPVPGLSQSQIDPARKFGFPEALRAMLRQDPQVILIGEIRDPETAKIAIEASLTGHLILTTIHSKQVTGVFPRLLSLGVGAVRVSSAILAVLNQRLLRFNCSNCASPYLPSEETLRWLPPDTTNSTRFMRGTGCEFCAGTGFFGRTVVSEMLVLHDSIRSLVCAGAPSPELYKQASLTGMRTLWDNALDHVFQGRAPLEETLQSLGCERSSE
jgi:type II secretory ATPase GspE/PulE/Tfp pilus assembly ATPase PilB-like protein